jgi:quercetin dioxygenase-like cupin family protein
MSGHFFHDAEIATETVIEGKVTRKIRAHEGKLMMVEVLFEAGAEGSAHVHPHEQVTYCLEGEFVFSVGPDSRKLKPGDSVYVPTAVVHGTRCSAKGRLLDVFTPQREDFLKK